MGDDELPNKVREQQKRCAKCYVQYNEWDHSMMNSCNYYKSQQSKLPNIKYCSWFDTVNLFLETSPEKRGEHDLPHLIHELSDKGWRKI